MSDQYTTLAEPQPKMGKKIFRASLIGFILSALLMVTAYLLVSHRTLGLNDLYFALSLIALLLVLVQVIFFLRLHDDVNSYWNLIALIFTIIIIGLVVTGSLWIMHNLNYNMMKH